MMQCLGTVIHNLLACSIIHKNSDTFNSVVEGRTNGSYIIHIQNNQNLLPMACMRVQMVAA